jgi:predicted amidohydrolase
MRFKVALLQIVPYSNDQSRNLAKGLRYCRDAKAVGADLVVFPELWNIGSVRCPLVDATEQRLWTASAIDQHNNFFRSFAGLARDLRMNIAITYLEVSHPKPRNSVSIIDTQGDVVLNYSKVCICDFGPEGENAAGCDVNCSPGESFGVCTLTGVFWLSVKWRSGVLR